LDFDISLLYPSPIIPWRLPRPRSYGERSGRSRVREGRIDLHLGGSLAILQLLQFIRIGQGIETNPSVLAAIPIRRAPISSVAIGVNFAVNLFESGGSPTTVPNNAANVSDLSLVSPISAITVAEETAERVILEIKM
jgi:hypothetical protein